MFFFLKETTEMFEVVASQLVSQLTEKLTKMLLFFKCSTQMFDFFLSPS